MDIVEQKKELHRIKKFTDMCAMKACKTAVTVGLALSKRDMIQLVSQLAYLQSPWNCPHGRPTVIELGAKNIFKKEVKKDIIYNIWGVLWL